VIISLVLMLIFLGTGVALLVYAPSLVERSKRPGSRWIVPEANRLTVLRLAGGFYTLIGLLIAYGTVHPGR